MTDILDELEIIPGVKSVTITALDGTLLSIEVTPEMAKKRAKDKNVAKKSADTVLN